jgi:hypothetical protein
MGHVHERDPSKADWYPFLQSADALVGIGMENTAAMLRVFDQEGAPAARLVEPEPQVRSCGL